MRTSTKAGLVLSGMLALGAATPESDPLREAHEAGERDHVLVVFRLDSAIESLNDGSISVFGTRRELRCPGGELVSESRCAPCVRSVEEWGERAAGVWMYEMAWNAEEPEQHTEAIARAEHFGRHFELEKRGGSERPGGNRFTYFAFEGKRRVQEPSKVMRVRLFVDGQEASAARIEAGSSEVEVEARAQRKGEGGGLVEFPEASIRFSATCGAVRELGPGRAGFALAPGVARCELKATAMPGAVSASLGVTRETQVEITYRDQAADEIVLEGADVVVLGVRAVAAGEAVEVAPKWTAEGGLIELLEGASKVKFRLKKGASRGEVRLLDGVSGAGDVITVRRAGD